jgi:hypothetical protein
MSGSHWNTQAVPVNSRIFASEARFGFAQGTATLHQEVLGANPYRYQLWVAVGVLHRFNRILSCKSPHHQGQLAVSCRLDGKPIDPQHILRSMSAAAIHFHNKLDVFHCPFRPAANANLDPLDFGVRKIPSDQQSRLGYLPRAIEEEPIFR